MNYLESVALLAANATMNFNMQQCLHCSACLCSVLFRASSLRRDTEYCNAETQLSASSTNVLRIATDSDSDWQWAIAMTVCTARNKCLRSDARYLCINMARGWIVGLASNRFHHAKLVALPLLVEGNCKFPFHFNADLSKYSEIRRDCSVFTL